eukprot:7155846-Prymnesium_polylepis.1
MQHTIMRFGEGPIPIFWAVINLLCCLPFMLPATLCATRLTFGHGDWWSLKALIRELKSAPYSLSRRTRRGSNSHTLRADNEASNGLTLKRFWGFAIPYLLSGPLGYIVFFIFAVVDIVVLQTAPGASLFRPVLLLIARRVILAMFNLDSNTQKSQCFRLAIAAARSTQVGISTAMVATGMRSWEAVIIALVFDWIFSYGASTPL